MRCSKRGRLRSSISILWETSGPRWRRSGQVNQQVGTIPLRCRLYLLRIHPVVVCHAGIKRCPSSLDGILVGRLPDVFDEAGTKQSDCLGVVVLDISACPLVEVQGPVILYLAVLCQYLLYLNESRTLVNGGVKSRSGSEFDSLVEMLALISTPTPGCHLQLQRAR